MESFLEVGIQLYLQIQVLYYLFRNNKSKLSAVNNLDIRHWESNQLGNLGAGKQTVRRAQTCFLHERREEILIILHNLLQTLKAWMWA